MNRRAFDIVRIASGDLEDAPKIKGRAGGIAGGKARASKLSPEERKKIATQAATARHAKKKTQ